MSYLWLKRLRQGTHFCEAPVLGNKVCTVDAFSIFFFLLFFLFCDLVFLLGIAIMDEHNFWVWKKCIKSVTTLHSPHSSPTLLRLRSLNKNKYQKKSFPTNPIFQRRWFTFSAIYFFCQHTNCFLPQGFDQLETLWEGSGCRLCMSRSHNDCNIHKYRPHIVTCWPSHIAESTRKIFTSSVKIFFFLLPNNMLEL